MSDEQYIDVHSVLDQPEKWARESLREDGFTDAFIDAWIQFDDGWDLQAALELIISEHDYKFLLIRHIQYLRDQLSDAEQSPIDWVWEGFLIAWLHRAGSLSEDEKIWFSNLQRENQKGARNRTSLPKMAVEYIVQKTPPYTAQERGGEIEFFRNFVGELCRITVKGITIDITSVEVTRRKTIIGYVFDDPNLPSNEIPGMTPMSTIRSIISRRNNRCLG